MKAAGLIALTLAIVIVVVLVTRDAPRVTIGEGEIDVAVTELGAEVVVENTSTVPVIVFVETPDGKQQFHLDVGDSITVTDLTEPVTVWTVGA